MVKPPDNPNIGSEIFPRNYQERCSRNGGNWRQNQWRRHADNLNTDSSQTFYQQCQQRRKRICQNSKHYPYRTWKWLELYRIAYPDPYSGPGPGPGTAACNNFNVKQPPLSASPAILPLGSSQPLLTRRLDDSVVIIAPYPLSMTSLWPKSRRRPTSLIDVHTVRFPASGNHNHRYRHKPARQHRQELRQSWAFSRSFLYFLIALICIDSGSLLVNCDLTTKWVNLTSKRMNLTASPNSSSHSSSSSSTSNSDRNNYNTNSRTIRLGTVDNNYTNFLNLNNSKKRNDIIKTSNTTADINFKYRTNEYKKIFINYNDIYTNNDNNYNNNQYYNTNKSNIFTSSNSKFNQTRNNTNSNSNNNTINNNNNTDTSSMMNNINTNTNKISMNNINHINVESDMPKSNNINNNHNNIFTRTERVLLADEQWNSKNQHRIVLRPLNSLDAATNTLTSTMLTLGNMTTVSTIIQETKNSMKASLNAIKNFKLGKFVATNTKKKLSRSKLSYPGSGSGSSSSSSRPRHMKANKRMLSSESYGYSDIHAEKIHGDEWEEVKVQQQLSSILKNKRTIDNNQLKQLSNSMHQVATNNDGVYRQYSDEKIQQHYQHYKRQEQAKNSDPVRFDYEQQYKTNGYQVQENPQENHMHRRGHNHEDLASSENHLRKRDRSQEYHYDHHYHHHQHNHNHERHQPFKSHPMYDPEPLRDARNSLSDENYRRSILASISCPNCVYNTDPYLTGMIFNPSPLSDSSSASASSSLSSPLSSSPSLSSSFSSSSQLDNYQNSKKPRQLHQHQHQQHELPHQKQHDEQHSHFVYNSPQYPINNNNNNNNENFHESNKQSSKNTQSNNIVFNYNTINSNSNPFQQSFHQLDSDQIRLESIKHQILSKLGLKSKPNVTQTLPKQFIMETIYRAESGGGGGGVLTTPTTTRHSDSAGRLISNSFSDSYNSDRASPSQDNSANDFFYSDNVNTDSFPGDHQYQKVNTESISNRLVSQPTFPHARPVASSSSFSSFSPTRITEEFPGADDAFRDSSVDSVDKLAKTNGEAFGGYNGRPNSMIGDTTTTLLVSQQHSLDPAASYAPLSPATSSTSSSEQDDFYGKTKEIITFAEKGSVLNGHRLIEFSSLSDQMTGQNLRIRTASMWIRVDLRPMPEMKRHRNLSARLKLSSVDKSLKIWVFRLMQTQETNTNSTEFDKQDFDQTTTLSTTQNVQFSQLGWQKLDITETVQNWYANDRHMRLRLLVDCSGCGDIVNLHLFNTDQYSELKKGRLHSVDRGHRRHHYQQRHRPLQAQKSNHHSGQKHRLAYRDEKYFHGSINRTGQSMIRKGGSHAEVLVTDRRSKGLTTPNFYRDKSQVTLASRPSHRSNEITKLTEAQAALSLANEDHTDRLPSSGSIDPQEVVDPNRPFLVIHTEPNVMKRVRRRALDCSGALNGQCCKESFYVSFKALGWDDWIIAPHGYFANYCRGDCAGPRTPDTYQSYHTHVMEEFRKLDRLTGMQPCCAPLKFSSMSLIYYGKEGIIKRDLPKMVVDECGCP